MKRAVRAVLWVAFGLFFLFPLYAMADFSTRDLIADGRTLQAWTNLVTDDALYQAIVISLLLAAFAVAATLVILVPTMIWVRLRAPWARGAVEFRSVAADDPRAGDRRRPAQRVPVGDVLSR